MLCLQSEVDEAVKLLLALKSDYKAATGVDWKPVAHKPAQSNPAPCQPQTAAAATAAAGMSAGGGKDIKHCQKVDLRTDRHLLPHQLRLG